MAHLSAFVYRLTDSYLAAIVSQRASVLKKSVTVTCLFKNYAFSHQLHCITFTYTVYQYLISNSTLFFVAPDHCITSYGTKALLLNVYKCIFLYVPFDML